MLDSIQMEAARHGDGPCLVLAGPGSGKTTVITERIRYLTEEQKKPPDGILVVTFTKAAAAEMRDRFLLLTGNQRTAVTFGTFHAVFFQILKHAYHIGAQNILREEQRIAFVKQSLIHAGVKCDEENECVHDYLRQISYRKNTGLTEGVTSSGDAGGVFAEVFLEYERQKQRKKLLDLDDLLTKTYELLMDRADLRSGWQKRFQYLLVDEFQDINPIQYRIVRLLSSPEDNLFVVGDDDQSIYRFRGSSPEIMLHFPEDYPECKKILLGKNYRCSAHVVEAAGKLIRHNKTRFDKELIASRDPGEAVKVFTFRDAGAESDFVVSLLKKERKKQMGQPMQTAVLFRTNSRMSRLAECLLAEDIPIRTKEHIPNPYRHFTVLDLFAYFAVAEGSNDRRDFLRILNRPKRYIGRDALMGETVSLQKVAEYYRDKPWIVERIRELETDLLRIGRMNPYAGINYIRRKIGYDAFLTEYAGERNLRIEELLERLDDLQDASKGYRTMEEWRVQIDAFTKELWRKEKDGEKSQDAVTLATLHGSKGLEFDRVLLYDMNAGVMPYHKAKLPEELEEERRMVYVGMTRAKKELMLLALKNEKGDVKVPSPYIMEACQSLSSVSSMGRS